MPKRKRASNTLEGALSGAILDALRYEADLFIWRQNTGAVKMAGARFVRFGLCRGSSDLIGLLAPSGRFVALEVKRPGSYATAEQKAFLELVQCAGGFGCIVRSVAEARAAIDRARKGANK